MITFEISFQTLRISACVKTPYKSDNTKSGLMNLDWFFAQCPSLDDASKPAPAVIKTIFGYALNNRYHADDTASQWKDSKITLQTI